MGMAVPPEALILGRCSVWGNKVKNTEPAAYFTRRLTGAQECARISTINKHRQGSYLRGALQSENTPASVRAHSTEIIAHRRT